MSAAKLFALGALARSGEATRWAIVDEHGVRLAVVAAETAEDAIRVFEARHAAGVARRRSSRWRARR